MAISTAPTRAEKIGEHVPRHQSTPDLDVHAEFRRFYDLLTVDEQSTQKARHVLNSLADLDSSIFESNTGPLNALVQIDENDINQTVRWLFAFGARFPHELLTHRDRLAWWFSMCELNPSLSEELLGNTPQQRAREFVNELDQWESDFLFPRVTTRLQLLRNYIWLHKVLGRGTFNSESPTIPHKRYLLEGECPKGRWWDVSHRATLRYTPMYRGDCDLVQSRNDGFPRCVGYNESQDGHDRWHTLHEIFDYEYRARNGAPPELQNFLVEMPWDRIVNDADRYYYGVGITSWYLERLEKKLDALYSAIPGSELCLLYISREDFSRVWHDICALAGP